MMERLPPETVRAD